MEIYRDTYAHRNNNQSIYVIRNIAPPSSVRGLIHRFEVPREAAVAATLVDLGICRFMLQRRSTGAWLITLYWLRHDIDSMTLERRVQANTVYVTLQFFEPIKFRAANLVAEQNGVRVALWQMYFH
jgi:hypothetical protein